MESKTKDFAEKENLLKQARLGVLRLHKALIDIERGKLESESGKVSSGQFLQILLSDENFAWLRQLSALIAEIDEMLDLNDGFSAEMVEEKLLLIKSLLDFKSSDQAFNTKYQEAIKINSDIESGHNELQKLFA